MSTRAGILEAWYERTVNTYPAEVRPQLLGGSDQFRNPVVFTLRTALGVLIEEVGGGMNSERVHKALDEIVRLRAVQGFDTSAAIRFVYLLRDVAREQNVAIADLDRRVDELAQIAFDVFTRCREQIEAIRARDAASVKAHLRCRA